MKQSWPGFVHFWPSSNVSVIPPFSSLKSAHLLLYSDTWEKIIKKEWGQNMMSNELMFSPLNWSDTIWISTWFVMLNKQIDKSPPSLHQRNKHSRYPSACASWTVTEKKPSYFLDLFFILTLALEAAALLNSLTKDNDATLLIQIEKGKLTYSTEVALYTIGLLIIRMRLE